MIEEVDVGSLKVAETKPVTCHNKCDGSIPIPQGRGATDPVQALRESKAPLRASLAKTVCEQSPRRCPADQQRSGAVYDLRHPDSPALGTALHVLLHRGLPLLGPGLPTP